MRGAVGGAQPARELEPAAEIGAVVGRDRARKRRPCWPGRRSRSVGAVGVASLTVAPQAAASGTRASRAARRFIGSSLRRCHRIYAARAVWGPWDPSSRLRRSESMDRRDFLAAAAAPLLLRRPPALAHPTGGTPLALVTADLESSVVAVDVRTGRVLRRLHMPADPRSIESIGVIGALVAHTAGGRMTLIDSELRVRPIAGEFGAPRYTAVSPDIRLAYVGLGAGGGRDRGRSRAPRRRASPSGGTGRVILGSTGMAFGSGSLSGTEANTIAVLSLAEARRPRVVGTIRPPFLAHDVGFTPGGRRVWVTSGDRGRIAIYEALTGKLVRTLAADAPPQHVTFMGDSAFVTSGDDAVLRVHALDGRLLRSASVPARLVQHPGSDDDERRRWILTPSLSAGTLSMFSPRGAALGEVRVARSSHDACFIVGT